MGDLARPAAWYGRRLGLPTIGDLEWLCEVRSIAASACANDVGCELTTRPSIAEHPRRRLLVAPVAGECGQPQQAVGGQRVGRRRGVVEHVLLPDDERLGVVAGREEPAGFVVVEQPDQVVGHRPREVEPGSVVVLGERAERLEQRGVVLGVGEVRARATSAGTGRRRAGAASGESVRSPRAAARQSSRSSAEAASMSAPRNSAFQASRTLSSSPGRMRSDRRASRRSRLRCTAAGRFFVRSTTCKMLPEYCVCGSTKFPPGVTP